MEVLLIVLLFTNGLFIFLYLKCYSDLSAKLLESMTECDSWEATARKYYRAWIDVKAQYNAKKSNIHWKTILGFSKQQSISKSMIDSRYRQLAKIYHPDLNSGQGYAMTLLNLAKEKADKEFS